MTKRNAIWISGLLLVYFFSVMAQTHDKTCFEECLMQTLNGTECSASCSFENLAYSNVTAH